MAPANTKALAERVVSGILESLEKGVAPWRQPWTNRGGGAGMLAMPRNLISKKAYRGINVILLGFQGYDSPFWLTFKQAKTAGGSVRKGETGTQIVFWKPLRVIDRETGEEKSVRLLRIYTVFNTDQCDGLKVPATPGRPVLEGGAEDEDITTEGWEDAEAAIEDCFELAERLVADMPKRPTIHHRRQDRAYYNPAADSITLPEKTQFRGVPEYFETLFHELIHSTGHPSRLAREGITDRAAFGSETYGKEELVAELGSAMLCNIAGLPERTQENAAAYCKGWLDNIKADPSLLIKAASGAQKAVDFILGTTFETAEKGGES